MAHDAGEHVVEVVRDATREAAETFRLLRLEELQPNAVAFRSACFSAVMSLPNTDTPSGWPSYCTTWIDSRSAWVPEED